MKTFFLSGRFWYWIAATAIIIGAGICANGFKSKYSDDEAGGGAALLAAGILLWLRARVVEQRYEQRQTEE